MAKKKVAKKTTKKKAVRKKATKKRGRGNPGKNLYAQLNLDQVRALCEKGFTDVEMADFFGVCEKTWNVWKNKHPEFKELLYEAKDVANKQVEAALFGRATGYSHPEEKIFCQDGLITRAETVKHYAPDPTSCIFWLKNRDSKRWKDKQDVELTGQVTLADAIAKARSRSRKDENA